MHSWQSRKPCILYVCEFVFFFEYFLCIIFCAFSPNSLCIFYIRSFPLVFFFSLSFQHFHNSKIFVVYILLEAHRSSCLWFHFLFLFLLCCFSLKCVSVFILCLCLNFHILWLMPSMWRECVFFYSLFCLSFEFCFVDTNVGFVCRLMIMFSICILHLTLFFYPQLHVYTQICFFFKYFFLPLKFFNIRSKCKQPRNAVFHLILLNFFRLLFSCKTLFQNEWESMWKVFSLLSTYKHLITVKLENRKFKKHWVPPTGGDGHRISPVLLCIYTFALV